MNHPLSNLQQKFKRPAPPHAEVHQRHMSVTNLTRNTVLADALELAGSGPRRRKGLLGREGLAPGEGLWIVPCEAVHTFGMRFPIDLVYLDRQQRIVKTRTSVPPGRLSACLTAHSVLELPSGTIRETQTMPGDALAILSAGPTRD